MKKLVLATSFALLLALDAHAQIAITYVGSTGFVNQQPGSSTNFIDFWTGNYQDNASINNVSLNNTTLTSSLSDFSFSGGVNSANTQGTGFSVITTAAGQTFTTGVLQAFSNGPTQGTKSIAFAVEPVGNAALLNNFDMFLMYSNTNGNADDLSVSVAPRSSVQNGGDYGAGAPTTELVTDNLNLNLTGAPTTANYLEFHVTGLGTAIADGYSPDLVVSAISDLNYAYIGGVSFAAPLVDTPEPSTWAMMLGGLATLGFAIRRKIKA